MDHRYPRFSPLSGSENELSPLTSPSQALLRHIYRTSYAAPPLGHAPPLAQHFFSPESRSPHSASSFPEFVRGQFTDPTVPRDSNAEIQKLLQAEQFQRLNSSASALTAQLQERAKQEAAESKQSDPPVAEQAADESGEDEGPPVSMWDLFRLSANTITVHVCAVFRSPLTMG